MNIGSALVLLAVIWFMVFFVVLPIGLTTQGDAGKRLKGTSAGSPEGVDLWRKVRITSFFAVLIWVASVWLISSGLVSVETLDFYNAINVNP